MAPAFGAELKVTSHNALRTFNVPRTEICDCRMPSDRSTHGYDSILPPNIIPLSASCDARLQAPQVDIGLRGKGHKRHSMA